MHEAGLVLDLIQAKKHADVAEMKRHETILFRVYVHFNTHFKLKDDKLMGHQYITTPRFIAQIQQQKTK